MAIHPSAFVSSHASISPSAQIGPFSVIEADVQIGAGCQIASHATIKSDVRLGEDNIVEEGVVLGGRPQHVNRIENPGPVIIGDRNVFRENVTVHRAMHSEGETRLGNDCLFMVGAHVAHDCQIGDHVVLTNNVMIAGHVEVGDRAYLGGGVAVHQFCRIGRLAMVGGLARVPQDVPPFVMIDGGTDHVVGLNRVGLRRAGFTLKQISDLKEAYQLIYRSGLSFEARLQELTSRYSGSPASEFESFFRGGSRGFVRERRTPPGATIRPIHDEVAERTVGDQNHNSRKAG